jgi:hypothetical protein
MAKKWGRKGMAQRSEESVLAREERHDDRGHVYIGQHCPDTHLARVFSLKDDGYSLPAS